MAKNREAERQLSTNVSVYINNFNFLLAITIHNMPYVGRRLKYSKQSCIVKSLVSISFHCSE